MRKFTITKGRFLDWYFNSGQDQEKAQLRKEMADSIIHQMYSDGHGSMSVAELFVECNQDAIRLGFTEQYNEETDDPDVELLDLNPFFEIKLIDNKNKYPFNEGDDYWTIENGEVVWSCWDDISEELFDENPNKKTFKSKEEAEQFINQFNK